MKQTEIRTLNNEELEQVSGGQLPTITVTADREYYGSIPSDYGPSFLSRLGSLGHDILGQAARLESEMQKQRDFSPSNFLHPPSMGPINDRGNLGMIAMLKSHPGEVAMDRNGNGVFDTILFLPGTEANRTPYIFTNRGNGVTLGWYPK
ncbi:hypothetical protein [uncultured Variovorax sp.]|uniref:hypothetical protein n=1 Tax=uncultured Variovorax sp. TaxID=114708 RepID=UPI0025D60A7A|nr:hypothetical protein [uncultured Variovorax sp.]